MGRGSCAIILELVEKYCRNSFKGIKCLKLKAKDELNEYFGFAWETYRSYQDRNVQNR